MNKILSFALVAALLCVVVAAKSRRLFTQGRVFDSHLKNYPVTDGQVKANMKQFQQFAKQNANPFDISGFFNVNKTFDANMYYVFFPSKDGNANAPIILWLQGGPGCSSMAGLFVEMGPYRVDPKTLTLVDNPNTWNLHYHMLFIDNPVGAGFSYVNNPDGYVTNEDQVANELYSTLTQFFQKYSQYAKNDFYVFGESYAGKYVPAIASKIKSDKYKINLKGIGIGDGLTHPVDQFANSYSEWTYNYGLINAVQRDAIAARENATRKLIDQQRWSEAMDSVDDMTTAVLNYGGNFNVYDIRLNGDYDFTPYVSFLQLKTTQELMHTTGHKYKDCDDKTYNELRNDMPKSIRSAVIDLLEEGKTKVLLYNGNMDWIINSNGAMRWINGMPWSGQQNFLKANRIIWTVNGQTAGFIQNYKTLSFLEVKNAGHLLPMDQGKNALDFVTRFVENKPWN